MAAEKIVTYETGPNYRRYAKRVVARARRRFERRFIESDMLFGGKRSDVKYFVRG